LLTFCVSCHRAEQKPVYILFHPTNCMNTYCVVTSLVHNLGNATFAIPVIYLQIICTHFCIYNLAFFL
jgi:hypothetical protein